MATYVLTPSIKEYGLFVKLAFGEQSFNDRKVVDAEAQALDLPTPGGVVALNGPCSWHVALTLGHVLAHRFEAVLAYEPPLNSYVCVIAHGGRITLGQVFPCDENGQPVL